MISREAKVLPLPFLSYIKIPDARDPLSVIYKAGLVVGSLFITSVGNVITSWYKIPNITPLPYENLEYNHILIVSCINTKETASCGIGLQFV